MPRLNKYSNKKELVVLNEHVSIQNFKMHTIFLYLGSENDGQPISIIHPHTERMKNVHLGLFE